MEGTLGFVGERIKDFPFLHYRLVPEVRVRAIDMVVLFKILLKRKKLVKILLTRVSPLEYCTILTGLSVTVTVRYHI